MGLSPPRLADRVPQSAVLGSYFLHERLGILGKLGCALCLLGSVVIVLHAPPDKPVETVDEILDYAIQPGTSHEHRPYLSLDVYLRTMVDSRYFVRVPYLLPCGCDFLDGHDLPSGASLWKEEPLDLYLYLLNSGLRLRHVRQGLRNRSEAHIQRKQPIHTCVNIRLHDRHRFLHPYTDELL